MSLTNISRYEPEEDKPTFEILTKLANALSISADYLMNGSIDYNAEQTISNKVLLDQFKKVEQLPEPKKKLVKKFLDAFMMKADLQKKLAI